MQRQSESQRKSLRLAAESYHRSLPGSPAAEHLESRGLAWPSILVEEHARFKLGYVAEPLPGHEQYEGFLAIPYLRWSHEFGWSVVSIRFRRLDGGKPKYLSTPGDRPRLYNASALLKAGAKIAITEGEMDAIASEACGIPAVGVPGATAWQPHFREPFLGYKDVFVFADGDDAGMQFAGTVAKSLPNAKVLPMPKGHDVNSTMLEYGKQAIIDRIS